MPEFYNPTNKSINNENDKSSHSWAQNVRNNFLGKNQNNLIKPGESLESNVNRIQKVIDRAQAKVLEAPKSEIPEIEELITSLEKTLENYTNDYNSREVSSEIKNITQAYDAVKNSVDLVNDNLAKSYKDALETFDEIKRLYNPEAKFKLSREEILTNIKKFLEDIAKSIQKLEQALQDLKVIDQAFANKNAEIKSKVAIYEKQSVLSSLQSMQQNLEKTIQELYDATKNPSIPRETRIQYEKIITQKIDLIKEILRNNS